LTIYHDKSHGESVYLGTGVAPNYKFVRPLLLIVENYNYNVELVSDSITFMLSFMRIY
jgi:hypothetical protein